MKNVECKVLCKVVQHGDAYGVKNDTITLPEHVAKALAADKPPRVEILKQKESKS